MWFTSEQGEVHIGKVKMAIDSHGKDFSENYSRMEEDVKENGMKMKRMPQEKIE